MSDMEVKILDYFGEKVRQNEPLKEKVSFRAGGVADFYMEAESIQDIIDAVTFCYKNEVNYFVLGGGYNILPSDAGYNGLVIKNQASQAIFSASSSEVIVESGIGVSKLINLAASRDLCGLEFMFGIPGTIGGAVYGNAGAFGHEIGDFIKSATLLVPSGESLETIKVDREWFNFKYRSSKLKEMRKKGENIPIILTATLQLARRRKDEILKMMKENLEKKKMTQPLTELSAGSYFKNAGETKELAAGYLLEKAGGKKIKIGDATVSSKHANFLINKKNASATDIKNLSEKLKSLVLEKNNISLEEEIEYIGNW